MLFLLRVDNSKKVYIKICDYIEKKFGEKVAKYAIKHKIDAVIMYDTTAYRCFEILEKEAPYIKRIMDSSAANLMFMRDIYEVEMINNKEFSEKIYSERSNLWNENKLKNIEKETILTDYFITPSNFVTKSYKKYNPTAKYFICYYGVDTSQFTYNPLKKSNDVLSVLYVGGVLQIKGISYLLEALKEFDINKLKLTLVGKYDNSTGVFDKYLNMYTFLGMVTPEKISELCSTADLMIIPSLGDGFSLAGLEGLSCGLPLICTENTGISDVIVDGFNGFVIPIGNSEAIRTKVNWLLENRDYLLKMSSHSRKTAEKLTWNEYDIRVREILNQILN